MKSYGVEDTARRLIFSAVSEFGAGAWQSNATAKAAGEPRFLPEALLAQYLTHPFDASRTWSAVRSQIAGQPAVPAEDPNPQLAATCARAIAANAGG